MDELKIDLSYEGNNKEIIIIQPYGDIDATTYTHMEKTILNQLSKEYYKIIVNLAKCEYVNSSGWGAFIREIREIRKNNGDLVIVNMLPDVHLVYETMEFSKILKSFPSLQEGVSYFLNGQD